jgi:hypothetical protein
MNRGSLRPLPARLRGRIIPQIIEKDQLARQIDSQVPYKEKGIEPQAQSLSTVGALSGRGSCRDALPH